MSVTATLPAPPETCLGTGLVPSTRHRVAAISSGLGGLTATKALKHDLANITDAVVFSTRLAAQGTALVVKLTSPWGQVIPAAAVATFGALITLYIARVRGLEKTPRVCRNHHTPMDALPSTNRRSYEITTTAGDSSCNGLLWHSHQTSKGWF